MKKYRSEQSLFNCGNEEEDFSENWSNGLVNNNSNSKSLKLGDMNQEIPIELRSPNVTTPEHNSSFFNNLLTKTPPTGKKTPSASSKDDNYGLAKKKKKHLMRGPKNRIGIPKLTPKMEANFLEFSKGYDWVTDIENIQQGK